VSFGRSFLDRLTAWSAALVAPPLAGGSLLKRVTCAAGPDMQDRIRSPAGARAIALASLTEQRVRWLARLARAPRRLGLPVVPGWRDTCLARAFAATLALRARGFPAMLAIGVRRAEGTEPGVSAHAWVTLDGCVLVDSGSVEYVELSPASPRPAGHFVP
jgi:hypothetical protein